MNMHFGLLHFSLLSLLWNSVVPSLAVASLWQKRREYSDHRVNQHKSVISPPKNAGSSTSLLQDLQQYGTFSPEDAIKITQLENSHRPVVFYIKDIHLVPSVQLNIAALLEILHRRGIGLVGLEGAEGELSGIKKLQKFSDRRLLSEVMQYLLWGGYFSGAEFAAVASSQNPAKEPLQLYGVEYSAQHAAQVKTYHDMLPHRDSAFQRMTDLKNALVSLKQQYYSSSLEALDQSWHRYKNNLSTFQQWVETLDQLLPNKTALKKIWDAQAVTDVFDVQQSWKEMAQREKQVWAQEIQKEKNAALIENIHRLDCDFQLLERAVDLKLTWQEWRDYRDREKEILRLDKHLESIGARALPQMEDFLSYGRQVHRFNTLSEKRSQTFVRELLAQMQRSQKHSAVLIAGGFHSEEIQHLLKKSQVECITIQPRISLRDSFIAPDPLLALNPDATPLKRLFTPQMDSLSPWLSGNSSRGVVDTALRIASAIKAVPPEEIERYLGENFFNTNFTEIQTDQTWRRFDLGEGISFYLVPDSDFERFPLHHTSIYSGSFRNRMQGVIVAENSSKWFDFFTDFHNLLTKINLTQWDLKQLHNLEGSKAVPSIFIQEYNRVQVIFPDFKQDRSFLEPIRSNSLQFTQEKLVNPILSSDPLIFGVIRAAVTIAKLPGDGPTSIMPQLLRYYANVRAIYKFLTIAAPTNSVVEVKYETESLDRKTMAELIKKRDADQLRLLLLQMNEVSLDFIRGETWGGANTDDIEFLAEVLKDNPTIKKLSLSNNSIGDGGAIALANLLKTNKALHTLELTSCHIAEKGIVAIGQALKENKTLTCLHLDGNYYAITENSDFIQSIKNNHTLLECRVNTNNLATDQINSILSRNKKLSEELYNLLQSDDPQAQIKIKDLLDRGASLGDTQLLWVPKKDPTTSQWQKNLEYIPEEHPLRYWIFVESPSRSKHFDYIVPYYRCYFSQIDQRLSGNLLNWVLIHTDGINSDNIKVNDIKAESQRLIKDLNILQKLFHSSQQWIGFMTDTTDEELNNIIPKIQNFKGTVPLTYHFPLFMISNIVFWGQKLKEKISLSPLKTIDLLSWKMDESDIPVFDYLVGFIMSFEDMLIPISSTEEKSSMSLESSLDADVAPPLENDGIGADKASTLAKEVLKRNSMTSEQWRNYFYRKTAAKRPLYEIELPNIEIPKMVSTGEEDLAEKLAVALTWEIQGAEEKSSSIAIANVLDVTPLMRSSIEARLSLEEKLTLEKLIQLIRHRDQKLVLIASLGTQEEIKEKVSQYLQLYSGNLSLPENIILVDPIEIISDNIISEWKLREALGNKLCRIYGLQGNFKLDASGASWCYALTVWDLAVRMDLLPRVLKVIRDDQWIKQQA